VQLLFKIPWKTEFRRLLRSLLRHLPISFTSQY